MNDPFFKMLQETFPVDDTPCRVMADLRYHESEEDRLTQIWEGGADERRANALEGVTYVEALKAVLNDEQLAAPLAKLMENLPAMIEETCAPILEGNLKVTADAIKTLCCLREILIQFQLGEQ